MKKILARNFLLAVAMAFVPTIALAQADPDLPTTATATCFSICLQSQNVQGVSGDISIQNLDVNPATLSATVKVQCNGTDVVGATQTVGGLVAAHTIGTFRTASRFHP